MSENKGDKKVFLTPAGAIIALICFFLPWVKVSYAGKVKNVSGAEVGGIFWLVLVSALAIIGALFLKTGCDKRKGINLRGFYPATGRRLNSDPPCVLIFYTNKNGG
jgi:hypothetical protein